MSYPWVLFCLSVQYAGVVMTRAEDLPCIGCAETRAAGLIDCRIIIYVGRRGRTIAGTLTSLARFGQIMHRSGLVRAILALKTLSIWSRDAAIEAARTRVNHKVTECTEIRPLAVIIAEAATTEHQPSHRPAAGRQGTQRGSPGDLCALLW